MTGVLNVAFLKYSLHEFSKKYDHTKMTLHFWLVMYILLAVNMTPKH